LDGQRLGKREATIGIKDGRPLRITVVSRKDLNEYIRNREKSYAHQGRISLRGMASQLGVSLHTVYHWSKDGCPHLEGGTLDTVRGHTCENGHRRVGLFVSKRNVEQVRKRLTAEGRKPFKDDQGSWLPVSLAVTKYPHARKALLLHYRNKPCPQLSGDTLHARQIPWTVQRTNREATVWAFLESDLKRLQLPSHAARIGTKATDQRLSETQRRIAQAVRDVVSSTGESASAQQVADELPYKNNSHFRALLAWLVQHGYLRKERDGYRVL